MKPGKLDLPTIWRGCEYPAIILKWKNPDGTPFNLAGWLPFAETRTGISLNPIITDEENGVTQMSLNRLETGGMKLGVEQWDWVWWNSGNGNTLYPPILSGSVLVDQPTTHDFPYVTP